VRKKTLVAVGAVIAAAVAYAGYAVVQTDAALAGNPNAIEWPTTGADVNRWEESNDIATSSTPHDGDVVTPS